MNNFIEKEACEPEPKKEQYVYGMNNPVPHVRNYRGRGGVETWGTQR